MSERLRKEYEAWWREFLGEFEGEPNGIAPDLAGFLREHVDMCMVAAMDDEEIRGMAELPEDYENEPLPEDIDIFTWLSVSKLCNSYKSGKISREKLLDEMENIEGVLDSLQYCEEDIISKIKEKLGPHYTNLMPYREGGTALTFTALYGGKERRIVKIDKRELESPRAIRHVERGCDRRNDLEHLLGIDHPNITKLLQFEEIGEGYVLTVEPCYEGETLEEVVESNGPLPNWAFRKIFSGIIKGARYMINKKKTFHRDIKPSNLIICYDDEEEGLEIKEPKITDLANAIEIGKVTSKYLPTAGGHYVMDPLLIPQFTGDTEAKYSEQSEMYAIGASMFYALTGKYIFEFDPDKGTAKVSEDIKSRHAGKSLLDENGLLNRKKYAEALDDAIRMELPFYAGANYGRFIERCLTLNAPNSWSLTRRYKSIEEMERGFRAGPRVTKMFVCTALFTVMNALSSIFGEPSEEPRPVEPPAIYSTDTGENK
jgi:serine/threonine protein kinase